MGEPKMPQMNTSKPEDFISKKEEISIEQIENIKEVFKLNGELEQIGTPEEYEKYLKTIFPDSKVKEIVWHGSSDKVLNFEDGHSKRGEIGIWFNPFLQPKKLYKKENFIEPHGKYDIPAILNLKNPFILPTGEVTGKIDNIDFSTMGSNLTELNKRGFDGLINNVLTEKQKEEIRNNSKLYKFYESIVFNSEQIHILGSKADTENFKSWVENQKKEKNETN